jgi:hypothetical protein
MEKRQFTILFREFLFNMIDLELLSAQALGDISKLLGQFAAFLFTFSCASGMSALLARHRPGFATYWRVEHSNIALTMLIMGIFAVLSWESAFPNRRDVLVLGPLPIRVRTMFAAKVASLMAALGLTVVFLDAFMGISWAQHFMRQGSGLGGYFQSVGAAWVTAVCGAAFIFASLLALQGLAAQLPRRYFMRLSAFLQMAAFAALLGGYFLAPPMPTPPALLWEPDYWFFALFHQLNGTLTPQLAPAAQRAWIALAAATFTAAVAFLLAYLRTVRKIVEEPDIAPAVRGLKWLPPFGGQLESAIAHFSIRTLLRSRQHRIILAFFVGIGFAIVGLGVEADHRGAPGAGWMIASVILMNAAIVGTRVVFAMPIDLRSNWIFRMTRFHSVQRYLSACRRPLFALAVLPAWLAAAAGFLWAWPVTMALQHLAVLALWGAVLAYACLYNFQKIPFTCSYLPGKSQAHFMIIGGLFLLLLSVEGCTYEFSTFSHPRKYAGLIGILALAAIGARFWALNSAASEEADVVFEESMEPAVIELHIQKDGFLQAH